MSRSGLGLRVIVGEGRVGGLLITMDEYQEKQGGWRIRHNATHRAPRGLPSSTESVSRTNGVRGKSPAKDGEQRWGWEQPPTSRENDAGVASRHGGGVAAAGVPSKRCEPRRRQPRELRTGGAHARTRLLG